MRIKPFVGKMVHCECDCTWNQGNVCTRDYIHINYLGKCSYNDNYLKKSNKEENKGESNE